MCVVIRLRVASSEKAAIFNVLNSFAVGDGDTLFNDGMDKKGMSKLDKARLLVRVQAAARDRIQLFSCNSIRASPLANIKRKSTCFIAP